MGLIPFPFGTLQPFFASGGYRQAQSKPESVLAA